MARFSKQSDPQGHEGIPSRSDDEDVEGHGLLQHKPGDDSNIFAAKPSARPDDGQSEGKLT